MLLSISRSMTRAIPAFLSLTFALLFFADAQGEEKLQFNRDIRTILSNSCYTCHGPDATAREDSGLRLDMAEDEGGGNAGYDMIVPGDPESSELFHRITTHSANLQMPPADSGLEPLTPEQIETIRLWIEQGAEYEKHWAFLSLSRPETPQVETDSWVRNDIDSFILSRLEEEGLSPSPEASRETLIRRVTLDLTGMPPTLEEIDAYLADDQPGAYERVVDRLLASPRYGERMAVPWLDLSRYADSSGYQYDKERQMWSWREWVIAAYNENKPFDEFTIEQLAGDLLPDATDEQKIATGFNRNHPITIEGGVIDEEYRNEYVMDRVVTLGGVWLGLTMNCSRCHDHKYDPLPMDDFYQIYAFFNQMREKGRASADRAGPMITITPPLRQRQIDALAAEIEALENQIAELTAISAGEERSADDVEALNTQLATLQAEHLELIEMEQTTCMILQDNTSRKTYVLDRGQYDSAIETREVQADVPHFLPPLPEGAPRNRLGLAQWLVDPSHPLTARVAVNRYWNMYFGVGFVKTMEDFGVQGEWPSHPELLDWLASEFISSGWDIKGMQKMIVMSAAYRQSSVGSEEGVTNDPENRLVSRGPRFRLEGEFVRDNTLAISGLLIEKLGGPSVYPYHPRGLWVELNNRGGNTAYPHSHGEHLYRRSMYTFWKRSVPPPSLNIFDAPEREFCTIRRSRTNTPLQALVLLHDPQYVEAARFLAERMMGEGGDSIETQISYGFRLATARFPTDEELALFQAFYAQEKSILENNEELALERLSVGEKPRNEQYDSVEHATMMAVARVILNLHEVVTRE